MLNALSIFTGLDQTGAIRFVGDVPRGAACGCICSACGAPLVAKRGEQKKWHFAHEASQERPDCFSGAVNLLRRLAICELPRLFDPLFHRALPRFYTPMHRIKDARSGIWAGQNCGSHTRGNQHLSISECHLNDARIVSVPRSRV